PADEGSIGKGVLRALGTSFGSALTKLGLAMNGTEPGSPAVKTLAAADPVVRNLGGSAADVLAGLGAIDKRDFAAAGTSFGSALTELKRVMKGTGRGLTARR